MFIRIFKPGEDKELLINVDHISKIEVEYVVPGKEKEYWRTSLSEGMRDPAAKRWYKVHVAGEVINLLAGTDDRVRKAIEDIYQESIKG